MCSVRTYKKGTQGGASSSAASAGSLRLKSQMQTHRKIKSKSLSAAMPHWMEAIHGWFEKRTNWSSETCHHSNQPIPGVASHPALCPTVVLLTFWNIGFGFLTDNTLFAVTSRSYVGWLASNVEWLFDFVFLWVCIWLFDLDGPIDVALGWCPFALLFCFVHKFEAD